MYKLPLIAIVILGISFIPFSFSEEIPTWVKNNASWWSDRLISQSEFTNGLEFLINEGIIFIPPTEPLPPGPDKIIPDWVRNTAGWWSDNKIPDSDFINAMKYLIEIGIIEVDASSPEILEDNNTEETIKKLFPLNITVEGISGVHANKNFELDIKIFDSETYSGNEFSILRQGIDDVDVRIELFNQEGDLIHSFDTVTKYKGLVQYVVHAKETSQDRGLWLIKNDYTVKITATLGEKSTVKFFEFVGLAHEQYYNQAPRSTSAIAYRIDKAVFNQSLDISGTVTTPEGLIFSPDGTKMFVPDNDDDKINQFTLSTPWVLSSATQSATSAATGEGGTDDVEDLAFNDDGTKMFIIERDADKILEYNLSNPYDVSSSSMTDADDDLTIANGVTNNPEDLAFSSDGKKMFLLENDDQVAGDQVFEYTLSTAWDVSTASLVSGGHFTLSDSTNADAFEFSTDGTQMFVADPNSGDRILKYRLTKGWDVSTASLIATFDISAQESASRGLAFGDSGKKFFVTGTSDTVWQWNMQ